ncbi:hypothetical protein E4Z66_00570 [Aliishimia ponticola]|uniref:Uncharacterized protein n=1 Tax=Aliishimia ponticola TaxID=2499833 RepID=A0A4S4NEY1_9RHOB|nr:hypothetical protein [Aliishimia ponticola]THH38104.1 hypothetical protein E4Z66_00570 [Aliishimia ponticola]
MSTMQADRAVFGEMIAMRRHRFDALYALLTGRGLARPARPAQTGSGLAEAPSHPPAPGSERPGMEDGT